MSCMLNKLTPFTAKEPPEGVDLFVCGNPENPKSRCCGIMQYFRKGTVLSEIVTTNAKDERIIDVIFHQKYGGRPAPETGFYFLEAVEEDDDGDSIWLQSSINPLDAVYAIINPEDVQ